MSEECGRGQAAVILPVVIEANVRKGKSAKEISPIVLEALRRIDTLFEFGRSVNAQPPEARLDGMAVLLAGTDEAEIICDAGLVPE